jgi:SAM-dependent methyltransferase
MRYMTTAERGKPGSQHAASRFFAEPVRDYVLQRLGQPISVLQAGCLAPLRELALDELAEGGFDVSVTAVDSNEPLPTRVLSGTASAYDDVITGDLRTVPIPQRAYDVVYCALLLERVRHVELVLDRLTSALKPGGLLLVRTGDRYTATAFLNRMLPGPARKAVWSRFRPGLPGPFPPVYEKAVSRDGIAGYALMRGLVIAARGSELTRPGHPGGLSSSVRVTCAAISRLSGGHYDNGHDELLYVIRKPLDRFARVVLANPAGRDAGVQRVRLAVLGDDRARTDDRSIADGHPGHDHGARAEPAAIADAHLARYRHPRHLPAIVDLVHRGDDHHLRADEDVAADVDDAGALEPAAHVDEAAVADGDLLGLEPAVPKPGHLRADPDACQPQQGPAQGEGQQVGGHRGHPGGPAQYLGAVVGGRPQCTGTPLGQLRVGQRPNSLRCHKTLQARSNASPPPELRTQR